MSTRDPRVHKLLEDALGAEFNSLPPEWCVQTLPLPADAKPEQSIVLVEQATAESLVAAALQSQTRHVVATEHPLFAFELKLALHGLRHDERFFSNPLALLVPAAVHAPLRYPVAGQAEKPQTIDRLLFDLNARKYPVNLCERVIAVADELLMNGLYNAPTRAANTSTSNAVELFWATDSSQLVVGVQDSFGSLDVPPLLERMNKVYAEGTGPAMNMGEGGAGIGMRMVFDHCSSLYLIVEPGQKTIVCASFVLGPKRRARTVEQKSLHILIKNFVY